MEEIIFWKEVDVKDELPIEPGFYYVIFSDGKQGNDWYKPKRKAWVSSEISNDVVSRWLKRVVINILSDQKIINAAKKEFPITEDSTFNGILQDGYRAGYKAMQERLIGGEGL